MSILIPLLMALAAPHPNDRLFEPPADPSLEDHVGQPLWQVMARCAKASVQEAEDFERMPETATYRATAESYGMTAEEMRSQDVKAALDNARRYLTIAAESIAADRGIAEGAAGEFMMTQIQEAEPIVADYLSDPCFSIAEAIAPIGA